MKSIGKMCRMNRVRSRQMFRLMIRSTWSKNSIKRS